MGLLGYESPILPGQNRLVASTFPSNK